MTLHLLKLCVGCDTVEDLRAWQASRLRDLRTKDPRANLMHVTRQTPRREGFAEGSSIYWVIGGFIRARQKITGLEEIRGTDGISRCGLCLDPVLIATDPCPRRAFQGWRYLPEREAPRDLPAGDTGRHAALPPAMEADLRELALI